MYQYKAQTYLHMVTILFSEISLKMHCVQMRVPTVSRGVRLPLYSPSRLNASAWRPLVEKRRFANVCRSQSEGDKEAAVASEVS